MLIDMKPHFFKSPMWQAFARHCLIYNILDKEIPACEKAQKITPGIAVMYDVFAEEQIEIYYRLKWRQPNTQHLSRHHRQDIKSPKTNL